MKDFQKRKAWLITMERGEGQEQECWFLTENDAKLAQDWLQSNTRYYISDPLFLEMPMPRTFSTFLREIRKK